jgi:hypothetical protein
MDSQDVIRLLVEIRDTQREHLEEYRRMARESLELSRLAVQRQEQFRRLYRGVLIVGGLALIALGLYLAWIAGVFRN